MSSIIRRVFWAMQLTRTDASWIYPTRCTQETSTEPGQSISQLCKIDCYLELIVGAAWSMDVNSVSYIIILSSLVVSILLAKHLFTNLRRPAAKSTLCLLICKWTHQKTLACLRYHTGNCSLAVGSSVHFSTIYRHYLYLLSPMLKAIATVTTFHQTTMLCVRYYNKQKATRATMSSTYPLMCQDAYHGHVQSCAPISGIDSIL